MAELTTDERADVDLVLKTIYGEYYAVHPSVRPQYHWVMDADMWRMVTGLKDSSGCYLWVPLPDADWLLSLPVEIRDGAEGIRLVPSEATGDG